MKNGNAWTLVAVDSSSHDLSSWTSIAIDNQGEPHISYQDGTTGDLLYAVHSGGVWTKEVADPFGLAGLTNALALDGAGNPHVAYGDNAVDDLRYARKIEGAWIVETVDGSTGRVGPFTSLALDVQGNVFVSYRDLDAGDLRYARRAAGVWTIETVDGLTDDAGYNTSIAIDAQGNPRIGYRGGTQVRYAAKSGGVWTIEATGASGASISLALDAQGNPHLSFDSFAGDLMYARKAGGVWTVQTEDASANFMTDFTSIALDQLGSPHVAYYDGSAGDLKYAKPNPTSLPSVAGVGPRLSVSPNPSAGGVLAIAYDVRADEVRGLTLYDTEGRRVARLDHPRGGGATGSLLWDWRDDRGNAVAPGVYVLALETTGMSATRKVILLR